MHFHIVSFDLVPSESKDLHFLFRFVGIKWVSKYSGDPNDRDVRYSNGGLQSGGQMARLLNLAIIYPGTIYVMDSVVTDVHQIKKKNYK